MPFSLGKLRGAKKGKADNSPLQSSSSHEDFANVPPPPPEQVKSISEGSRRAPSRHLLGRHQDRANKKVLAPPSSASPPARRSFSGRKPPTLTESVDEVPEHYMNRPLPPLPPASPPRKNTVNVDGYEFEICNATTMPQPTKAGYANPPGRPRLVDIPPRKTRASSRGHKRADSAQEDSTTDAKATVADTTSTSTDTKDFASNQPDSPSLPAPLTITKSATNHESSSSSNTQHEEVMAPSPSTITMRKKRPSIDEVRDQDRDVSPHTDIDEAAAAAFAAPTSRHSQEIGVARSTPDYPPGLPIRQAARRTHRNSSGSRYSTVTVRPPYYDETKIPAHQFISESPNNSRPTAQWGWTKRWTCCKCGGQTIVEQIVCACLECAHDRCPERCALDKTDKLETSVFVSGKVPNAANAGRVD